MRITAHARRAGGWWAVEVPEVPGAFTQARRLEQVAEAAASAVADLQGVDDATIEVELAVDLDPGVLHMIEAARQAADAAAAAQAEASSAMRLAVKELRYDQDLTTRDAATLLGVTHQRVSQLGG